MTTGAATDTKRVRFASVEIREYPMTLGTNPATSIGAPVCLDWEYIEVPAKSLDEHTNRPRRRRGGGGSPRDFYLNYYQRVAILDKAGFSKEDIRTAERSVRWDQRRRKWSQRRSYLVLYFKAWRVQFAHYKARRFVRRYRKEHGLPQQH